MYKRPYAFISQIPEQMIFGRLTHRTELANAIGLCCELNYFPIKYIQVMRDITVTIETMWQFLG